MTDKLNCKGFENNIKMVRPKMGGVQYLFEFENGYGASVIKHLGSYGSSHDLWELAVIRFDDGGGFDLVYDTPITDGVLCCLTDEEVCEYLRQIKGLA